MGLAKVRMLILLVAVLSVSGMGKTETIASQWAQNAIKIDGQMADWVNVPLTRDKSLAIDYAFQNDGKNLYIVFVFNDPQYLSTVSKTGITVWVNTEGKKKKKLGVKFQSKQVPVELLIAMMEKESGKPLAEEAKANLRQKKVHLIKQCTLEGEDEAPIPTNHPLNPEFEARMAAQAFVWELRLPLNFPDAALAAGSRPGLEPGMTVNVGFEWGGMTAQMRGEILRGSTVRGESSRRADATSDLTREYEERVPGSQVEMGSTQLRNPKTYSFWAGLKLASQQ